MADTGKYQDALKENMALIVKSQGDKDKNILCNLLLWRVGTLDRMCADAAELVVKLTEEATALLDENERLKRLLASRS